MMRILSASNPEAENLVWARNQDDELTVYTTDTTNTELPKAIIKGYELLLEEDLEFVYDYTSSSYTKYSHNMVYFEDVKELGVFYDLVHTVVITNTELDHKCYVNLTEAAKAHGGLMECKHPSLRGAYKICHKSLSRLTPSTSMDDMFIRAGEVTPKQLNYLKIKKMFSDESLPYKTSQYSDFIRQVVRNRTDKYISSLRLPQRMQELDNALGSLSFAVELETSYTTMPKSLCGSVGLLPLRDGSLPSQGCEYATIPLCGVRGLQTIQVATRTVAEYSKINTDCSLHNHYGNYPKTKEAIVALFYLWFRLQNEVMDILPYYLRDQRSIVGKRQQYCEPIISLNIHNLSIDDAYKAIYAYYMGQIKEDEAPRWGYRTWNCATRYTTLNLVNLFTKDGSGTVEFRVHPPSLDERRVTIWVVLCAMICNYAQNNVDYILQSYQNKTKITLEDVIAYFSDGMILENTLGRSILDYMQELMNIRLNQSLEASAKGNEQGGLRYRNSHYNQMATIELDNERSIITPPDIMEKEEAIIYETKSKENTKGAQETSE